MQRSWYGDRSRLPSDQVESAFALLSRQVGGVILFQIELHAVNSELVRVWARNSPPDDSSTAWDGGTRRPEPSRLPGPGFSNSSPDDWAKALNMKSVRRRSILALSKKFWMDRKSLELV